MTLPPAQFSLRKGATTSKRFHHAIPCVLLVLAAGQAAAQQPSLSAELQGARTLLERHADPIAAVHDGYLSTLACIDFPKGAAEGTMQYAAGAIGVHFINMQNVGPALDPAKPQVLIYEPAGERLQFVAAEWFIPVELVQGDPPRIFGQALQGPMEGHKPVMPAGLHHYDLHVWLWKENPEGSAVFLRTLAPSSRESAPVSHVTCVQIPAT